jgi:hypothetical protein
LGHFNDRTPRAGSCEPLERRVLLSTFTWTNRATTNFATVYGAANAALATAIVDRALADWGRILVNFNRASGDNTFGLTFNASNLGGTTRGSTGGIVTDANRIPLRAGVTMDNDGGGAGWYFDPTPGTAALPDDGEFTDLINPFMSRRSGGADFYRTVAHEICHAVGILLTTSGSGPRIGMFLTNTQVPDPNDAAQRLWAFNVGGGAVEATLSSVGGGHLYEGPAVPNHPELPFHPGDLINSGRSVTPPPTTRQLISDTDVMVLELAYGYTMLTPSEVNSFHANLDTTSNVLTVHGGPGASSDTITLDTLGGDVRVRVNQTSELFPAGEVDAVVVNAGDGADVINVDESLAGITITLNSSQGNDALSVNADGTGQARVVLGAAQRLGALTIGTGGALDVNGHALVIDYDGASPLASIAALLSDGYAGGAWTGDGVTWSAGNSGAFAVGYAEASDLFTTFPSTFAGQEVDDTSVLIRATRYGDADLDGVVNLNDFNRLAANFGAAGARWSQGNLNYDAAVNLDDFNLLAANFGAAIAPAAVPPLSGRAADERLDKLS